MGRITDTFEQLKKDGKKALICYLMANDPDTEATLKAVRAVREAGTDMIELGFPFSDPLAEGPTIQAAAHRALETPFTFEDYFALVRRIREEDSGPLLLMTYYNVVLRYGLEHFAKDAQAAGLDGIIIPDLPLEEAAEIEALLQGTDIDCVLLAAPTTPLDRITSLAENSSGFLYYVSRTGITGARDDLAVDLLDRLEAVVKACSLPLAVGFGVSKVEHAKAIMNHADGVVIGSALINRLAAASSIEEGCNELKSFLEPIAKALHAEE